MLRPGVLTALVVVLTACSNSSAAHLLTSEGSTALAQEAQANVSTKLDLRVVREELLATDQRYAASGALTNLVEALVAPLGPNAVFIAPGPGFARGPEQAREVLLINPNNIQSKWRWTAIRTDVSSDGNHGYTYGYTELELPDGTVLPGRYQAYWTRQAHGAWKMAAYRRTPRASGDVSLTPPHGFETPKKQHGLEFPNSDPDTERLVAAAADRAFSDLAQRVTISEAFAAYAAPDGAHSPGTVTVAWAFGPTEIAAARAGEPAGLFSWAPEITDIALTTDLAFTVGFVNQGGAVVGKYFTIWQKQKKGEWRFVVD